ncbi:MAG: hypothetical protein ACJ8R9_10880 [Steroidobacteraceae bacterium]
MRHPTFDDYEKAIAQKEIVARIWQQTLGDQPPDNNQHPDYIEARKQLKRIEWWIYPNDNCEILEIVE